MTPSTRGACRAVALAASVVLTTGAASSTDDGTEVPPELLTLDSVGGAPEADALDYATRTFEPEHFASTFDLENRIETVETVETEGQEVTVTLASDVLFDTSSAELSPTAADRVAELIADVADGETVRVDGHTDSVDTDEVNQDLSERRAQAVADVVAEARPDLTLEVTGHGESDLKVTESGDDIADDRAQNRRVEMRYTGTEPGESSSETETTSVAPVRVPYTAGAEPEVDTLDSEAVLAEQVVRVPESDGAEIRVGVEELVVRGSTVRLRLQLTPLDPVPGWVGDGMETDYISLLDMTGGGLHERLVDRDSLTSYQPVSFVGSYFAATDRIRTQTAVGRTMRYEIYFPRPVDDSLESLDVSITPTWPAFEDVAIRWDE